MKIRHRLTVAIIATSTTLTLATLFVVIFWQAERNEEKLLETFDIQNSFLVREFDRFCVERSADMDVAASRVGNVLQENSFHLAQNILIDTKNAYKAYQNIFFIDKNHIKRFNTNGSKEEKKIRHPFFEQARQSKKTIYEFYQDPDTKQEVMSFVRSVQDRKGHFLGVVVANIATDSVIDLTRIVANSSLGKYKKDVEIIRPDGTIFYSNFRSSKKDLDLITFVKLHDRGKEDSHLIDQGPFYWSITKLRTSINHSNHDDVYFVTRILKEDFNNELYKLHRNILAIFCLITVALIFIGSTIAKSISRPIEEASRAIFKLGEGDFNALDTIETTNDEYGVLVTHMKDMALKLKSLMTERTQKSRMASLGKMASDVAHEINNPLQVIYGHAQLLRRIHKQPELNYEKAQKSLDVIYETVERITKIITGLKNLSRDGVSDPFTPAKLDLIMESTFIICSEKLKLNGIFIHTIKPEESIIFDCRPVQISQVLLNLINNASDAVMVEEDKWIKVEIIKQEVTITFKVINSGKKIPDEISQNLFTPFFTTKPEGVGTGLGLSISMAIVHSHRGSIYIEPHHEHTCFVVTLPLKQDNIQNPPEAISA